jgi:23S rRNA (uracil1939-C5)-methyltransferase
LGDGAEFGAKEWLLGLEASAVGLAPSKSLAGIELVVERLVPEGRAIGRLPDGRIAFVDGAVPGDRIAIEQAIEARRLVQVQQFRLLEAGPDRVEPRCSVARQCGGCDWMMIQAEGQARGKLAILEQALLRTGKLDAARYPLRMHRSPLVDGYRGRVRLAVEGQRVGFYARGSHELVEPAPCVVSSPSLNATLGRVRETARALPRFLESFVSVEVREDSDGIISLVFQRADAPLSADARTALAHLGESFVVVSDPREADAIERWQRFQLTADTFMLSPPGAFTQVNWEVNLALIQAVLNGVSERGIRTFLDVYSGSGNFSLPLLARGLAGRAVESNALAVSAAREAARRQKLPEVIFHAGDALDFGQRAAEAGQSFDVVIIDPPRAGVKRGLAQLASLARGWLLMCSCNPVTLARDLNELGALGFEIEGIEAFDMFPETHHVETLVWLRKGKGVKPPEASPARPGR